MSQAKIIQVRRPKDNLPHRERRALTDLSRNKNILLKKANKGTATVIMNRQDKIKQRQSLLDDRNNYQPTRPMIESASQKVQQLVNSLSQEGHIDSMKEKWLSLTPYPPRNVISDGWVTLKRISEKLIFWRHDWEARVLSFVLLAGDILSFYVSQSSVEFVFSF